MAYIKKYCIDEVVGKSPVEDVVGEYVTLKKKGSALVGGCPWCDGGESLNVSKAKGIWKCFKCDASGGGAVSFVMKYKQVDYVKAMELLAERANVMLEYDAFPLHPLPEGKGREPNLKKLATYEVVTKNNN